MAPKKAAKAGKRAQRSAPSEPQPSTTLRRSSRIRQPTTKSTQSQTLNADANSVQTNQRKATKRVIKDAANNKRTKRVSFEGEPPFPQEPSDTLVASNTNRNWNEEANQTSGVTPSTSHAFGSPSLTGTMAATPAFDVSETPLRSDNPPPRVPSTLTPARKARLRLILQNSIISDAAQEARTKRLFDERDDDEIHPAPVKRRRRSHGEHQPDVTSTHLPEHLEEELLAQCRDHPQPLWISQVSAMLQIIQNRIFGTIDQTQLGFSQRHFGFTLTPAQINAWPLHELRTRYTSLYMTARFVADGSQYGWRQFFTEPGPRQHLVSAIISEWFVQRIFKHTAFGFPEHLVEELEEMDREYLHYDAIVRTKERAQLMESWCNNDITARMIADFTTLAAQDLAEELLTVLHPLLPPTIFDPLEIPTHAAMDGRKDSITIHKEKQRNAAIRTIKDDLIEIIQDCATLHKCIRLTGASGTIVRMIPHQQKGSRFYPDAPVYCVNQQHCNDTIPTDPNEPSELCIKMTCWPRVEAVVPNGPDMARLELLEREHREKLMDQICIPVPVAPVGLNRPYQQDRSLPNHHHHHPDHDHQNHNHVIRPRFDDQHLDNISISSSDDSSDLSDDDDREPDPIEWDEQYPNLWPIVPDTLQDKEGREANKLDPDTGYINTLKRAAYVTVYPALCPAKVYCEWTPQPLVHGQTLDAAIAEARRSHARHLTLRLQDLQISAWNNWAIYGGLAQWGFLSTAAVVSICRYFNVPSHTQTLVLKLAGAVEALIKAIASASSSGTTFDLDNLSAATSASIKDLIATIIDLTKSLGPFGIAMMQPIDKLVIEPVWTLVNWSKWLVDWVASGGVDVEAQSSLLAADAASLQWSAAQRGATAAATTTATMTDDR